MSASISALIERGGVYCNVEGLTPEEIFNDVVSRADFPADLDRNEVIRELLEREKVLSTAVGGGIAIPHPKRPLLKNADDERIIVCFLKKNISMQAPDVRPVFAFFILLSSSPVSHLKFLSSLAKVFHDIEFRRLLETRPTKSRLVSFLQKMSF